MRKSKTDRTFDGIVFDSVLEMRFYRDVILPAKSRGEIISCELQKAFLLVPGFKHNSKKYRKIEYIADFVVQCVDGRIVIYS